MGRKKKVGFNFYANTRVNGAEITKSGKFVKIYPLYVAITFDKKSAQLRVIIDEKTINVPTDFDINTADSLLREKLMEYTEYVKYIINMERAGLKEYSIVGISNRLKIYEEYIVDLLKQIDLGFILKEYQNNPPSPDQSTSFIKDLNDLLLIYEDLKVKDTFLKPGIKSKKMKALGFPPDGQFKKIYVFNLVHKAIMIKLFPNYEEVYLTFGEFVDNMKKKLGDR